jgi:hypothetical protein
VARAAVLFSNSRISNLSIHENPDFSQTDGVKIEPNGIFVAHSLGIVITSSSGIGASVAAAVTAGATQAVVQVDGSAAVSYRLDGVAPTASAGGGILIAAGGSIVLNMADAANALFIQRAATSVLNVTFTM